MKLRRSSLSWEVPAIKSMYMRKYTEKNLQKFGWSNLSRESHVTNHLTEGRSLHNKKYVDPRTIDILINRSKRRREGEEEELAIFYDKTPFSCCNKMACRLKYQPVVCVKFGKSNKEQSREIHLRALWSQVKYISLRGNRKMNLFITSPLIKKCEIDIIYW